MRLLESHVALSLALLATLAPAARAANSRVSGRVVDSDTQRPVANATVELSNASGGQGYFRARTGGDGRFEIDRVPTERWYLLTAGADGYADFVIGGWQFLGQQRAVELVIPLDRAGAVEVKLTRSDGRTPITGAKVTVARERGDTWWEGYRPPPAPVYTNAQGIARFEGLTAGSYGVSAESSDLRPGQASRVAVRRGETTKIPLPLTRPASLAGRVTLADGRGVAGVVVTARGPSESVGTTDAEGYFVAGDLAPGRYRLDVAHDGFQPVASRETYSLTEGQSRDGIALTATPKPPELAFVLQREAFAPDVTVRAGLRSFRVDEVDVAVYRIPNAALLDTTRDFRRYATTPDTSGLQLVTAWKHVNGAGPEWSWREGEVAVPQPLTPGAYVLRGRAAGIDRRAVFFVTDLGVVVKRDAGRALVWAGSLTSGRPVAGARVFVQAAPIGGMIVRPAPGRGRGRRPASDNWADLLADRPGQTHIVTGEDGLAFVTPAALGGGNLPSTLRVIAVSPDHGVSLADVAIPQSSEQSLDRTFLYTDRPLYRPGHELHWKLFARRAVGNGWAMPEATSVTLKLTGPDGAVTSVPGGTLSARGTADGTMTLPPETALGDWTLSATVGNATGSATVGVQEYRKPEFQVEVTPDRPVVVSGDEVRFRIAATYFFGAPVFGAIVRYNLFETRLARPGDDWDEDSYDESGSGYGRVLKTGETRTDLDGRAEMVLVPERVSYDRRLTLEVEVVDGSNRVVRGRGSAVMGRGLFTIAVRPRVWVLGPGQAVPIEVSARDHQNRPVSTSVLVELDQEAWNPIERRYTRSTRPLGSATVTTDREGRATLTLAPNPVRAGPLIVKARATDSRGNRIEASSNVWVWDERVTDYPYRYPALEAIADRERYGARDTVSVLVNTEARNAVVLATLEGRELHAYRAVRLNGGTGVVRFALHEDYAPNVFVTVSVRRGKEVHTRVLEIPVEQPRRDLRITLAPDRERYGPGDSARVEVTTRDGDGRPVVAELSLAAVDEAIFALRADGTPNPHDVFYGRRPNRVMTGVSFPITLLGGATKAERDEPRRDFRDVALWAPAIRTGADGRASASFRMPDNLTTWRLTGRGATDDTRVGVSVARTLVTRDLVARLAGPRFLLAGDQATLVSVATNRTDRPLVDVRATLETRGPVELQRPTTATFNIPAHGEARNEWTLRVPRTLPPDGTEAVLTLQARSAAASDALEVRVPVRPRAVPVARHGAGLVAGGSSTIPVALPSDLVRTGSEVVVDLSVSPAALARSAVEDLLSYDGGTERNAHAILAATALIQAARAHKATIPGWPDPAIRLAPVIRRLAAAQLDESGWGWWPRGSYDPYLTALAMGALASAVEIDVAPSEARDALQRGYSRLPRLLDEVRSLDGEAYVLAHLSPMLGLPGAKESQADLRVALESIAAHLAAQREALGNAGLAMATRGLAEIGRTDDAKKSLQLLMSRARRDAFGLSWPSDPEASRSWFGEDVEGTAEALAAVMRVAPTDDRASDIIRWLAAQRRGPGWKSSRLGGPAASAIAAYLARHPEELKPDFRMRVEWNGETVLERAVTPADAWISGASLLRIELTRLRPGANAMTIAVEGRGSVYWSWRARAMVPSPGPATAANSPIRLTRELLRAERTVDRRGRPRVLAAPLDPGAPLRVGESILVRLTLTATERLRWIQIEDPRVAGFEIDALLPDGTDRPWDTHAEERDDRAVFHLDELETGDTVIEYLVRPELAGTFAALPALATGVYDPDLRARSDEATVTVVERTSR